MHRATFVMGKCPRGYRLPMAEGNYRQQLRAVVSASAAPHGYTLTLWTTGAITTHAEGGVPSAVDALLLLVGAVIGFGAVGRSLSVV